MKGGGKSWGGAAKGGGKKGTQHKEKIRNKAKVVWIGGIPEDTTNEELKAHAEEYFGPAKWAEVFAKKGKGTGVVGFATEEEAQTAIAELNGTELNGSVIEADKYE